MFYSGTYVCGFNFKVSLVKFLSYRTVCVYFVFSAARGSSIFKKRLKAKVSFGGFKGYDSCHFAICSCLFSFIDSKGPGSVCLPAFISCPGYWTKFVLFILDDLSQE